MSQVGITPVGWSVAITPDPGELWPVTSDRHGKPARPDLILMWVQPGTEVIATGSGRRQRRDGSEGQLRVDLPWSVLADLPPWARELAAAALERVPA